MRIAAGDAGVALVGTEKDMMLEVTHGDVPVFPKDSIKRRL
jgi:hypothetical protein